MKNVFTLFNEIYLKWDDKLDNPVVGLVSKPQRRARLNGVVWRANKDELATRIFEQLLTHNGPGMLCLARNELIVALRSKLPMLFNGTLNMADGFHAYSMADSKLTVRNPDGAIQISLDYFKLSKRIRDELQ